MAIITYSLMTQKNNYIYIYIFCIYYICIYVFISIYLSMMIKQMG